MKQIGYLRVERFRLDRAQEWADERRAWRFVRIAKGTGYWISQGSARILEPREVLVVPPPVTGVVRASQVGELSFQSFAFDPVVLSGFFSFAERHVLSESPADLNTVLVLPPSHRVAERFESLATFGSGKGPMARRAEALGVVGALFDELLRRWEVPAAHKTSAAERFQQLVALLPDIEIIRLSPADLAALCGCSPGHLNRMFKRHFGVSARARRSALRSPRPAPAFQLGSGFVTES
jgi:AraC-like DNA-binding protein